MIKQLGKSLDSRPVQLIDILLEFVQWSSDRIVVRYESPKF